jgi:Sulfotransferase domain
LNRILQFLGIYKKDFKPNSPCDSVFELIDLKKQVKESNKAKIFLIGFNKTGTTSIEAALKDLGFIMGDQEKGELLLHSIAKGNYNGLAELISYGEAFQDVPFSLPNMYKRLHKEYPNARFILSTRNSKEEWYNSITKYHAKLWSCGAIPSRKELEQANYSYPGFALEYLETVFGKVDYDSELYMNIYEKHNNDVRRYFDQFPSNFLEIHSNGKIKHKTYNDSCY